MSGGVHGPTIVIDLDGTVLRRGPLDGLRLYLGRKGNAGTAFGELGASLKRLAGRFRIVAVTARARFGRRNTRLWLEREGLGFVELYLSPFFNLTEPGRAKYKSIVISALRSRGYDIRYGVGDRPSDMRAYAANGAFPVVVLDGEDERRRRAFERLAARLGLGEDDYAVFVERPGAPAWKAIADFIEARG